MPTNHEIETELRRLLRTDLIARPFLCDGSPVGCELVIVGINPGTPTPFWDYWDTEKGCDKKAWLSAFQRDPRNARNQTRPRIEQLLDELAPVRVSELNIYPYYTPNEQSLTPELKDVRVFDSMLRVSSPRLLFVFGGTPIKELSARLGIPNLAKGEYTPVEYNGSRFDVYADNHLSRGWSFPRVRALGRAFKARLKER